MSSTIEVPWDTETVVALNKSQNSPNLHPFTCPNRSNNHGWIGMDNGTLFATKTGWICAFCDYTQDWAYTIMAEEQPGVLDWLIVD